MGGQGARGQVAARRLAPATGRAWLSGTVSVTPARAWTSAASRSQTRGGFHRAAGPVFPQLMGTQGQRLARGLWQATAGPGLAPSENLQSGVREAAWRPMSPRPLRCLFRDGPRTHRGQGSCGNQTTPQCALG